jgi:hypothetical protein
MDMHSNPISRRLAQPLDGGQTCVTLDLVVLFCYTDEKGMVNVIGFKP